MAADSVFIHEWAPYGDLQLLRSSEQEHESYMAYE